MCGYRGIKKIYAIIISGALVGNRSRLVLGATPTNKRPSLMVKIKVDPLTLTSWNQRVLLRFGMLATDKH